MAHGLGTSGNKATLYSTGGKLIASSVSSYDVTYPGDGRVEQNAEDWWQAVCTSSRELMASSDIAPRQILCVSFSGQMMGCRKSPCARPLSGRICGLSTRRSA